MSLDFGGDRAVVGMVHLPPLPGAPAFDGDRDAIRETMVRDARRLAAGGVDAVMVENFGDAPFYAEDVPKHVVASMTALVTDLRREIDLPVGVNVLRNDAEAAVSIAAAAGASFVRVNVHSGARLTDQGVVTGRAAETVRLRERLDTDVSILADVDVKHSAPLADRPLEEEIAELLERGHADGVVASGSGTGAETDRDHLRRVVDARDELGVDSPVFVGSGVTASTAAETLALADGAIVGTALKQDGETTGPVDEERVQQLVEAAKADGDR
ncbi:BtpA/SgcQ family protein [Halorhabdus sp. CBA1104]|uniref:BtpA/SgcQ family protein n=1 Tax=unclassified Halorhabdus TaxID=2621901 RepID=UPI0012B25F61|nr:MULTISPECIES: BtpA/SgcQ family protein [unclassified Halorhabdus]QGN07863.1 BtpA/SgcQ family protein [Halorhabdus sp. CBA1104]